MTSRYVFSTCRVLYLFVHSYIALSKAKFAHCFVKVHVNLFCVLICVVTARHTAALVPFFSCRSPRPASHRPSSIGLVVTFLACSVLVASLLSYHTASKTLKSKSISSNFNSSKCHSCYYHAKPNCDWSLSPLHPFLWLHSHTRTPSFLSPYPHSYFWHGPHLQSVLQWVTVDTN